MTGEGHTRRKSLASRGLKVALLVFVGLVLAGLLAGRGRRSQQLGLSPSTAPSDLSSEDDWPFRLLSRSPALEDVPEFWSTVLAGEAFPTLQELGPMPPRQASARAAWLRSWLEVGTALIEAREAAMAVARKYCEARLESEDLAPDYRAFLRLMRGLVCVESGEGDCARWLAHEDLRGDPLAAFLLRMEMREPGTGPGPSAAARRWTEELGGYLDSLDATDAMGDSSGALLTMRVLSSWLRSGDVPAVQDWKTDLRVRRPHFVVKFFAEKEEQAVRFYDPGFYSILATIALRQVVSGADHSTGEKWLALRARQLLGPAMENDEWCALADLWSSEESEEALEDVVLFSDWESVGEARSSIEAMCAGPSLARECPKGEDAPRRALKVAREFESRHYQALDARFPEQGGTGLARMAGLYSGPARRRFLDRFLPREVNCPAELRHDALLLWKGARVEGTRWNNDAALLRWVNIEVELSCRDDAQEALAQLERRQWIYRPLLELVRFAGGYFKARCGSGGGGISSE